MGWEVKEGLPKKATCKLSLGKGKRGGISGERE